MKLLTLNTHSLVEENYEKKLADFIDAVRRTEPDVIALQEVNQSRDSAAASAHRLTGYLPCQHGVPIRQDNHAYRIAQVLKDYQWTWLPLKIGYDWYDEGLAILTRKKITNVDVIHLSRTDDYHNWKTRKALGICTENGTWYYSVHMSWWDDADEPFLPQWERIKTRTKGLACVWLMGDFNNPAEVRSEGYDRITADGWHDSYLLAKEKDCGLTVGTVIDGWREKITETEGMRIDQIWCSKAVPVRSSSVLFNGIHEPVVSDHYGVLVTLDEEVLS
ncbi:MAG: endonuclease/exonuclease/phosphatase family protein [Ruminococcus sp.]|nr:endonuclease/exonuclease/phosphatase family protein [Ruminococcus sp.]